MENILREVIRLDDTQKFKNLMYGKDGSFMLDQQYLTQLCALCDSPGCMAISILMGQPVNLDGDDVMAPLNCAAFSNSVETACLLIEAGAHPNSIYKGETPLMLAVRGNQPQLVYMLLDAKADLVPLEYAARFSKTVDVMLKFIDNGDKDVALDEAIGGGKPENVKALLEHGAKPTLMSLLIACSFNYYTIVKMLLDAGVQATDLAMQTCIYWTSMESMEELFKWGLKPIDYDVHYAILHNRPKSLKRILDEGAPSECEINGTLPIHVAARHGRVECMELLIEQKVKINTSDNLGCTPLHWAAIRRNPETLVLLLKNGAFVNIEEDSVFEPQIRKPTSEWSSIHASVEGRGFEVVSILLENGAKQIKMWDGRTPLHIAVMNSRNDLIPVLLKFGANLKTVNAHYQTPIELALSMGREDLAEELRKGAPADAEAASQAKEGFEAAKEKE